MDVMSPLVVSGCTGRQERVHTITGESSAILIGWNSVTASEHAYQASEDTSVIRDGRVQ